MARQPYARRYVSQLVPRAIEEAQALFLRLKRPEPLPAPATPLQQDHNAPANGEREETVH